MTFYTSCFTSTLRSTAMEDGFHVSPGPAARNHSLPASPTIRRIIPTLISGLFALVVLAGCASTKITDRQQLAYGKLPKPAHIWVYDFAATPADVPSSSDFSKPDYRPPVPQTSEEIAAGRQAGAQVAAALVKEIRDMGMPAEDATAATKPQIDDLVIHGYFVSIDEGSTTKRVAIGFGSGSSKLTTVVEGYQMTAEGLRKLGSGTLESSGNKTPGAGLGVVGWIVTGSPVGLVVSGGMKVYGEASGSSKVEGRAKATAKEIAKRLKIRFEEQGWIQP